MNQYLSQSLVCLCSLLFLFACKPQQGINDLGLVYCVETAPRTLNPQLENSHAAVAVSARHIYDRLVEVDPITQSLIPSLARSWTISDDGLRYVFELRNSIHFHQTDYFEPSRNLNADDVVFSFLRVLNSEHPFHLVSGGSYPYFDNTDFATNVLSVKALDEQHVTFDLAQADASFLATLASDFSVILSAEYAQQLLDNKQVEQFDLHPVGTGPFYFAEHQKGHFVRYYRHWLHWRGAPPMHQVVFDFTKSSSIRLAKLFTGQCDLMDQPASSQINELKKRDDLLLTDLAGQHVSYLAFNTQTGVLSDFKQRKQIADKINKNKIIESVYRETAQVANGLLTSSSWAYYADPLEFMKQPIAEDFAKPGSRSLNFWVLNDTRSFNPQPGKTAELIRNDLEMLGYKVHVTHLDWSVLHRLLKEEQVNYDVLLIGWSSENSDPDSFFRQQFSCQAIKQGYNFSRWCDPHFDQLLDKATSSTHLASRIRYYYRLQSILNHELPVIPLAHALKMYAYNDSISGITWNPYGGVSFHNAYRK